MGVDDEGEKWPGQPIQDRADHKHGVDNEMLSKQGIQVDTALMMNERECGPDLAIYSSEADFTQTEC